MKINLAKSAGFCVGVKRALMIAREASGQKRKICMLGDIVHNGKVVNEIKKLGITKINRLKDGKNKALIIRAHGSGQTTYQNAKKMGYEIIDATCPMVKEIHNIVKRESGFGRDIIVIGDKKHQEVQGITGQIRKKITVLDPNLKLEKEKIRKIKKATVVAQSTQNNEDVKRIVEKLKKYIKNLRFINTICVPTLQKQNEIKKMPRQNDIMLIIGSKKSANTKRLFRISKRINKKSYWIEDENSLKKEWLKGAQSVGITAGASTPESTITKVKNKLKKIQ